MDTSTESDDQDVGQDDLYGDDLYVGGGTADDEVPDRVPSAAYATIALFCLPTLLCLGAGIFVLVQGGADASLAWLIFPLASARPASPANAPGGACVGSYDGDQFATMASWRP